MGLVCRLVPLKIMSLEQLGLPPVIGDLTKHRQGLVLITGPTGSVKSTTLAAIIDKTNNERRLSIRSIEDPVAAVEIMLVTPTSAKLIEEGRAGNLYSAIQEGNFWGMQTMNQCLAKYYKAGIISEEDALNAAGNMTELRQMIRRPT